MRLAIASVLSLGLLCLPLPASAVPTLSDGGDESPQGVTTQELAAKLAPAPTAAREGASPVIAGPVVLTTEAGVRLLAVEAETSLEELFATHGLSLASFRDEHNKPALQAAFDLSAPVFLFQVATKAKTLKIPLKPPVLERKTSTLPVGERQVETEGEEGLALKTTVAETSTAEDSTLNRSAREKGSKPSPQVEHFTVVKTPKPKVVLVGTAVAGASEAPGPVEQGVQAPVQTVDAADLARLKELNRGNPVLTTALSKVGSPYVWGATGPTAFDCSGFVLWSFSQHGYGGIPRTSTAQGAYATPVAWDELRAGDLIWRPGHVGIYAGGGLVVHASNPRTGVTIAPLSWFTGSGFRAGRFPR